MTLIKKNITIKNKLGLHARPAAIFVQTANKFESEISIKKGNQEVNGKSIMGIMMLAAKKDSKIQLVADGQDAEDAIEELSSLLLSDIEPEQKGKR
ncbi:MAG: HPr family phosphocarrier protein [Candidatus Omnitrophica bacterium]|nr:HPr family phosphocarrier protein [Candidatus Omnitrophota bacterium]